jgi:hypothetical protein
MRRLALLIAFITAATQMWGQGAVGTILGRVTDPAGAVISGATVDITNEDTNVAQTTTTSSDGAYNVPYLKPGRYSVKVQASGFSATQVEHVNLLVDQSARVDATLKPGATTQQIVVSGTSVQLDTETASIGQVISEKQVSDLPLNGRQFTSLMLLQPGAVQLTGSVSGEQSTRPGSGDSLSLGGGRASGNQYLVDGVSINDVMYQTPAYQPSIDAIMEFKAQTDDYSAEYGSSANQINISYKSGTNTFHGTAYDFLRNNFFDARSYFDAAVPVLRQNQFGYSLGGPVFIPKIYNGKNKTFFFANYEGLRSISYATDYTLLPTPAELAGTFTTPVIDPLTGVPFPNNQVPQSRIVNFANVINKYYPTPNTNTPQGNYVASVDSPTVTDQQNYRIDQNFGTKNSIFGRYSRANNSYITGAVPETAGYNHPIDTWNYQLTYLHIFSASVVDQVRFAHLNTAADQLGIAVPQSVIDSLHLTGVYASTPHPTLPNISITGYGTPGGAVNTPWLNDQTTNDVSNSTTINHGKQTFVFGAEIRWWVLANNTTTGFAGQWTFNGDFSGNPIADYLLGNPQTVWATQPTAYSSASNPGSPVNIHYNSIAPFFQDDWKITPKLTLNLGVRYDWSSVPFEAKNHWSWMDPNIPGGGLCVADKSIITSGLGGDLYAYCNSRTAGTSQKLVLAPRFGFAYRPFDKWVVRSGYGLFYDTAEAFEDIGSGNIYPYTIRSTYTAIPGQNLLSTDNLFPNLATPGPVQVADLSFYEPQARKRFDPYVQDWSLSVERELGKGTKLEVEYVGSKGTHLDTRIESNQPFTYDPANPSPPTARLPYPNFGTIVETYWSAYSNYNAFNAKLESNIGNLHLLAAYTWAKSMDDKSAAASIGGDAAGWAGPMNSHDPNLDYSVSSYDVPQRFISSFIYALPVGRGQRFFSNSGPITSRALSGWQLNAITTFQAGFPFTVSALDIDDYNEANGQRANRVGNPYPQGFHRSVNEWFNTAAFANPPLGVYGDSPRNFLRMQGVNNWDMSLFKSTQLAERLSLELRLETFNTFNRVQFNGPDSYLPDPTFGVVSSAAPGRIVQIAGKLIF